MAAPASTGHPIDASLIDGSFPFQPPRYRPQQRESIEAGLSTLFDSGNKLYVVDAPVGFGKSPMLLAIARAAWKGWRAKAYYLTPQNILINQFVHDFPEVPMVKGRNNYTCLESGDLDGEGKARETCKCDCGSCQYDTGSSCPYLYKVQADEDGEVEVSEPASGTKCSYLAAKEAFLRAPISCTNFAYYFLVNNRIPHRNLIIIDEAHGIAEWAVNYVSVAIRHAEYPDIPVLRSFGEYVDLIGEDVVPAIKDKIRHHPRRELKDKLEINRLKRKVEALDGMCDDYEHSQEEWLFERDAKYKSIKFTPVTGARFLAKLLWSTADKVIVASGTIVPHYFMPEAGLGKCQFDPARGTFSARSTFPAARSPVYYLPIGKMSMDSKGATFPRIIAAMNEIISKRLDRHGLVHTFSFANAEYIRDNIDPRLRPYITMQDREDKDCLAKWLDDEKPGVFVSTAMTEGIDLKDDKARYQVYVKMGFPYMGDKRVARRIALNHWSWYNYQAIEDVEQASGRATRTSTDWAEMFILDASFGGLLTRCRPFFKQWFLDRLRFVKLLPAPLDPTRLDG